MSVKFKTYEMKKLLLIALCFPLLTLAQQTYVPDDNFEAYLEANGMGDGIANNDNDTSIPTSAAVVDYVANNGGDGLLVRAALATGATTSAVGTMPNVTGRTYYATKLVVKISTAVSGNNVNYITVTESGGNTLIAKADADSSTVGNYIVELDGDVTLAGGGTVTVNYFDASDNAVSPSAGAGVTSLYYNWTS